MHAKTLQMRLFERCFLVKIQGKTNNTMDRINILLKDSYKEILLESHELINLQTMIERLFIKKRLFMFLITHD